MNIKEADNKYKDLAKPLKKFIEETPNKIDFTYKNIEFTDGDELPKMKKKVNSIIYDLEHQDYRGVRDNHTEDGKIDWWDGTE